MKPTCQIRIMLFRVWMLWIFFSFCCQTVSSQGNALETSGDIVFVALPTIAFSATLFKKDKKGSNQFLKGFLVNFATTAGLKLLIDKQRPNAENGNSFPSGHTSVTFQSASFIQRRYGWKYGAPAYVLAGFTGYTRLNADKHDLIDVIAGAIIGVGSTYLFTTPYQRAHMELSFTRADNAHLIGFRFRF